MAALGVRPSPVVDEARTSNGIDAQHVAYLPDCDVFLTADRGYTEALDVVRRAAWFDLPTVALVVPVPGQSAVQQIEAALDR